MADRDPLASPEGKGRHGCTPASVEGEKEREGGRWKTGEERRV